MTKYSAMGSVGEHYKQLQRLIYNQIFYHYSFAALSLKIYPKPTY